MAAARVEARVGVVAGGVAVDDPRRRQRADQLVGVGAAAPGLAALAEVEEEIGEAAGGVDEVERVSHELSSVGEG
ncbi:hypothetical protein [Streptomyces koyangensis]